MVERWEPANRSVGDRSAPSESNAQGATDHRDELANLVLSCSGRAGVALLFIGLSAFRLPASGPVIVAVLLIAAGFAGCIAGRSSDAHGWSRVWLVDLATLGLLTPWLIFTGFVGAERDPLSTGSDGAYFGCLLASLIFLVLITACAAWAERGRPGIAGALVLPAALEVVTLTGALGNYRDAAVFQALGIAYAIGAVVIFLGLQASPALRVWVAPAGWLACVIGAFFLTSGFDVLSDSAGRVVFGQMLLIVVSAAMVIKAPTLLAWLPSPGTRRASRRRESVSTPKRANRRSRRASSRQPVGNSGWFYASADQSNTEELPSLNS